MEKAHESLSGIRVASALGLVLLAGLLSSQAMADRDGGQNSGWQIQIDQDHRSNQNPPASPPSRQDQRDHSRGGDGIRHFDRVEHDRDHYRSPYWDLDMRFQHNRYYPRNGYIVDALPPGYFNIVFRGNRFFFQSGVWFRSVGPNYVVTLPPVGIAIPALPSDYTTLWLGSVPYYYANDVYYRQDAYGSGYVVVDPPVNINNAVAVDSPAGATPPAAAIYPPPPPAVQSSETAIKVVPSPVETPVPSSSDSGLLFVYPNKGQSLSRMNKDRNKCEKLATEQTSHDPANSTFDTLQRENYQTYVRTCLEGRGYSVK